MFTATHTDIRDARTRLSDLVDTYETLLIEAPLDDPDDRLIALANLRLLGDRVRDAIVDLMADTL